MNYHSHERRDEVWTIISGSGRTIVDGMEQQVTAGDVITMQAGCRHTIIADSELEVMEVQLGREISVHDKQKLNWKNRKTVYKLRPFLLQSACKEALWGGQKLKEHFGKQADLDNIAESWECSTHPEGPSTVTTGEHKGMLLTEVLQKYPEYLGTHPRSKGELPILIKFIDARQKLSVQVHPDDEYAKLYERGQLGKTEMWYVLEADKDAELIYGFTVRTLSIDRCTATYV